MKPAELAKLINKQLGSNVLQMGSAPNLEVTYLPTGLLPFEIALGGGVPRGRFIMITGAYSTLKSYVGLHAIAQVQQAGGTAALIDTEHAFDPEWAREIGVDVDSLIVWPNMDDHTDHAGEEAIDAAEVLVRNGVDLIVFDSVAATLPQAEAGKRMHGEKVQPGRLAALMSLACRKLTTANDKTAVMWINQLREQIGVMFGNPEKATGGRALGYYSSIIMNVRTAGKVTKDRKVFTGDENTTTKVLVAQRFKIIIEKSKLNKPFTEVWFDFNLSTGQIDIPKFLFAQGVELGFVKQKGTSWSFGNLSARGKEGFQKALASNATAATTLEGKIRNHYGLPPLPGPHAPGRPKAGASKPTSSKSAGRKLTRTPGPAKSNGTVRRLKKS